MCTTDSNVYIINMALRNKEGFKIRKEENIAD